MFAGCWRPCLKRTLAVRFDGSGLLASRQPQRPLTSTNLRFAIAIVGPEIEGLSVSRDIDSVQRRSLIRKHIVSPRDNTETRAVLAPSHGQKSSLVDSDASQWRKVGVKPIQKSKKALVRTCVVPDPTTIFRKCAVVTGGSTPIDGLEAKMLPCTEDSIGSGENHIETDSVRVIGSAPKPLALAMPLICKFVTGKSHTIPDARPLNYVDCVDKDMNDVGKGLRKENLFQAAKVASGASAVYQVDGQQQPAPINRYHSSPPPAMAQANLLQPYQENRKYLVRPLLRVRKQSGLKIMKELARRRKRIRGHWAPAGPLVRRCVMTSSDASKTVYTSPHEVLQPGRELDLALPQISASPGVPELNPLAIAQKHSRMRRRSASNSKTRRLKTVLIRRYGLRRLFRYCFIRGEKNPQYSGLATVPRNEKTTVFGNFLARHPALGEAPEASTVSSELIKDLDKLLEAYEIEQPVKSRTKSADLLSRKPFIKSQRTAASDKVSLVRGAAFRRMVRVRKRTVL